MTTPRGRGVAPNREKRPDGAAKGGWIAKIRPRENPVLIRKRTIRRNETGSPTRTRRLTKTRQTQPSRAHTRTKLKLRREQTAPVSRWLERLYKFPACIRQLENWEPWRPQTAHSSEAPNGVRTLCNASAQTSLPNELPPKQPGPYRRESQV